MGILAPLYLAGLAALALPLLFHLVRRTPRGKQVVSSLMFLTPTPPQLTRRSRLDQWLLLLLRAVALAILAIAFARPFLRESAMLAFDSLPSRKVALLLDTSASLRRGDLWAQAQAAIHDELDDLNPQDEVALYTFSDRLQPVVGFADERGDASRSAGARIRQQTKSLTPTWNTTDLGRALVALAAELESSLDRKQSQAEPQIVLVSDLAKGAKTDALQSYTWPERVRLIVRRVEPAETTNAYAHVVPDPESDSLQELRVRVVNAADSSADQFHVGWGNAPGGKDPSGVTGEVAVYVPPGQSRVVKLPRGPEQLESDRIVLRGDAHDFDNRHYLVPLRKQPVTIAWAGANAAEDPQGLLYYLRLAVADDPFREVTLRPLPVAEMPESLGVPAPQVVIVSQPLTSALKDAATRYLEQGGRVLVVASQPADARLLTDLFNDVALLPETPLAEGKYLLLGQIDFQHPLFRPFANPRYSDFTQIQFWGRRPVALKADAATQAPVRFDDGTPAVLDRSVGQGRLIALTSGWHPDESQLALSGKFVPLIAALLDDATGQREPLTSVVVHQPVELPRLREAAVLHRPDGQQVPLSPDSRTFSETGTPGVYRVVTGLGEESFAVNLDPAESHTAPMNTEHLEQQGVRLGVAVRRSERLERMRQLRDTELEGRQKVWRWLVAGALVVLIGETTLAGWLAAPRLVEQPTGGP